jgi:hypothetical protein
MQWREGFETESRGSDGGERWMRERLEEGNR